MEYPVLLAMAVDPVDPVDLAEHVVLVLLSAAVDLLA